MKTKIFLTVTAFILIGFDSHANVPDVLGTFEGGRNPFPDCLIQVHQPDKDTIEFKITIPGEKPQTITSPKMKVKKIAWDSYRQFQVAKKYSQKGSTTEWTVIGCLFDNQTHEQNTGFLNYVRIVYHQSKKWCPGFGCTIAYESVICPVKL